jgi:transmembrane sensor
MPNSTDNDEALNTSTSAEGVLLDQALDLCWQLHDSPSDKLLLARILQWQQQSAEHQNAWQQAQAYWDASAEIKPQFSELGLFNRLNLALQIKTELIRENSSQKLNRLKGWKGWNPRFVTAAPIALSCLLFCVFLTNHSKVLKDTSEVKTLAAKPRVMTVHQTAWQQQREVILEDGSIVNLNWDTKISVTMNPKQRNIVLHRGEAHFNVAANKSRPFTVVAQGVSATAVGTAFVVHLDKNNQTTITVNEGIVEVASPATSPLQLTLKQQISLSTTSVGNTLTVDTDTINAWQQGMLVFHDRPLLNVLEELNRYTLFSIEAGLIYNIDRRVTGTYFINRADDALALIALAFNLELAPQDGNHVLVKSIRPKRQD